MAENAESAATETKKVINPRVEIDTSPPFESVKEAVDHFGGSGPWIPHHLLRLAAAQHENDAFDAEKIEEQAMQLERDLIMKEQQTLNVLKELESAKRFVQGLKFNVVLPEMSSFMPSPDLNMESLSPIISSSPGLMFTELTQAKLNLNKTSVDLAAIQASVESLNKKLRKDNKSLLHSRSEQSLSLQQHDYQISIRKKQEESQKIEAIKDDDMSMITLSKEVNFEAEQFKKMAEASRYEVMKAMAEIERTKNCIRMAEMRLNAAKKMEEAAKAVQAIALAEKNSPEDEFLQNPNGITLSFEEYQALSSKAKQADDLCKTKFIDINGMHRANEADQVEVPILEKFEEKTSKENLSRFKFRNSHGGNRNPDVVINGNESCERREKPTTTGFRGNSTTSMGDVLSRKFVVQDDVMVGRHVENQSEREHVSLSQMLREQSRLILNPKGERNVEKHYFIQRKKFGFIQVPIPTKVSKKKGQTTNMR